MLRECAAEMKALRPDWNISQTVTERHDRPGPQTGDNTEPVYVKSSTSNGGQQIFLADGYWGDISTVREGFLNTLWGILTAMFGLRHVAAIALDQHKVLQGIFWLIIAMIAVIDIPLNLFAMLYALVLLHMPNFFVLPAGSNLVYEAAAWSLVVTAVIGGVLGCLAWYVTRSAHAARPLMPKAAYAFLIICVFSAFAGVVGLSQMHEGEHGALPTGAKHLLTAYGDNMRTERYSKFKDFVLLPNCAAVSNKLEGSCPDITVKQPDTDKRYIAPAGIYLAFAAMLQLIPLWIEGLMSIVGLVLAAVVVWNKRQAKENTAGIILSVGSSFAVWYLFATLLLLVVPTDITTDLAIQKSIFPQQAVLSYSAGVFELFPAMLFVIVLVLTAAISTIWRLAAQRRAKTQWDAASTGRWLPSPQNDPFGLLVGPRLLFSKGMLWSILVIATCVALLLIYRLGEIVADPYGPTRGGLEIWLQAAAAAGVGAILLLVGAERAFRAGLKASMDVIDHFTAPAAGYPIRKRIAGRVTSSIKLLLSLGKGPADVQPAEERDHLYVFAHSQGTIVVVDRMLDGYFSGLLDTDVAKLKIITFGSPLTHIYQNYLDRAYEPFSSGLPAALEELKARGVEWINVYRIDDYVGTYITSPDPSFPVNVPLSTGGHTKYFEGQVFSANLDKYVP